MMCFRSPVCTQRSSPSTSVQAASKLETEVRSTEAHSTSPLVRHTIVHAVAMPAAALLIFGRDSYNNRFLGASLYETFVHWLDCVWGSAHFARVVTPLNTALFSYLLGVFLLTLAAIWRRGSISCSVIATCLFVGLWCWWIREALTSHGMGPLSVILMVGLSAPFLFVVFLVSVNILDAALSRRSASTGP